MPRRQPRPLSNAAALALDRARFGLKRATHGWAACQPGADPDDLIQFATVKALLRRGLLVAQGGRATLSREARP